MIQDNVNPKKEIEGITIIKNDYIGLPRRGIGLDKLDKNCYFQKLHVKLFQETFEALKKYSAENDPIVARKTSIEISSTKEFGLWKNNLRSFDQLITTTDLLNFDINMLDPENSAYLIKHPSLFHSAHTKKIFINIGHQKFAWNESMPETIVEFLTDQSAPSDNQKEVILCAIDLTL